MREALPENGGDASEEPEQMAGFGSLQHCPSSQLLDEAFGIGHRQRARAMRGAELLLQLIQQLHGVRGIALVPDHKLLPAAELAQPREQRPHRSDAGMLDLRPIAY